MISIRIVPAAFLAICVCAAPAAAQTTKAPSAAHLPQFEVGANFSTIAGEINAPGISLTWHRSPKSAIHITSQFRTTTLSYPAEHFLAPGLGYERTSHEYVEHEGVYSVQYQRISEGPVRVSWNIALYGAWERSRSGGYTTTFANGQRTEVAERHDGHTSMPFLPGTGIGLEIPVARHLAIRGDINLIVAPAVWDGGIMVGVNASVGLTVPFGKLR